MLVFGTISMGITLSVSKFRALRFIARQLNFDIDWDVEVKKFTSCLVPGTPVFNLKLVRVVQYTRNETSRPGGLSNRLTGSQVARHLKYFVICLRG